MPDLEFSHSFCSPLKVMVELLKGRSIGRAYLHLALSKIRLGGNILDIGAKRPDSLYWQYLQKESNTNIIPTDLYPRDGVLALDVEKPFNLAENSIDHVLGLNLLEHVGNLDLVSKEIERILRPGGSAIISTPFLYPFHPDPKDYRRFTDQGLALTMESGRNRAVHLQALGEGVCTLGVELMLRAILPSRLGGYCFCFLYPLLSLFDRILTYRRRVGGRSIAQRYPVGVLIILKKVIND